MVVPIEVPVETPAPIIEQALADLLGFLGALLAPVRRALFAAIGWLAARLWLDAILPVFHTLEHLNTEAWNEFQVLAVELGGLEAKVIDLAHTTVINVTGNVDATVDYLRRYADTVGQEVLHDAEGLYNAGHAFAEAVGQDVLHDAESLYNQAVSHADAVGASLLADAQDLYNQAYSHADAVADAAVAVAVDAYNQAVHYTDAAVLGLEGEIADTRSLAQALAAAVGAAVLARVITTVKDLYDPCCEFTTDTVKPAWSTVKGMLGKLTRRGPLVLAVMGLASEAVVGLDRRAIVAGLVRSRADDHGVSFQALLEWGGYRTGGH